MKKIENNFITNENNEVHLEELCSLYMKGSNIDWKSMYKGANRKKISLPTYRFEKNRCWITLKDDEVSVFDFLILELDNFLKEMPLLTMEYTNSLNLLRDYSAILLLKYFNDFNVFLNANEDYDIEELGNKMQVSSQYKRLFNAILDIMERQGFVSCLEKRVYATPKVTYKDVQLNIKNIVEIRNDILEKYPAINNYLSLLEACIFNFKGILQGKVLATNVIFKDYSVNLLENIYKNNVYIDHYHKIVDFALAKQIELLQMNSKDGHTIKILEIGSGTGGASQGVLESIADFKNIEYTYTDISVSLVEYGREHYGKIYDFMEFKRLDIAGSLRKQGYKLGVYDIVLAYDVLHATKNMNFTLNQVKKLLRKNGTFFVLEPTKLQDFSTLTFGTLDGWWLYEDEEIRIRNSPLLDISTWKSILDTNGFRKVKCIEPENGFEGLIIGESDGIYEQEQGFQENKDVIFSANKNYDNLNLSKTQNIIYTAWAESLGTTDISIDDSFYELGGDSIIAMKIVNLINQDLQINLKINELLNHETIKSLAEYIDTIYSTTSVATSLSQSHEYEVSNGVSLYEEYCVEKNRDYSVYRVSSAQKRMYILNKMQGLNEKTYNLPRAFIINGNLDIDKTKDAFEKIVQRHESLRTIFKCVDNEVLQVINKKVDFKVRCFEKYTDDYENLVKNFVKPFDLEEDILFRVEVVKVSNQRQILMVDMHHIISDGISINIVIDEFKKLYLGEELSPVKYQYKDYTIWQGEFVKSNRWSMQEQFWVSRFLNDIPVLSLPTDYNRENVRSFDGEFYSFKLEADVIKKLKYFALNKHTTLYNVLLSLYNVLLYKYSGQEDIVVGTVIAGRQNLNFEDVIGMFVNTIPMRNQPKSNITFDDFLIEVEKNSHDAFENQDYQFEQLVDKLKLKRDLSHNPIFDVMFVMQNMGEFTLNLEGLDVSIYDFSYKTSKFDITLLAVENETGIEFTFEYCTKLFKKETIARMSGHFLELLQNVIENPTQQLAEISMISQTEIIKITKEFNQNYIEYDDTKSMVDLFSDVVNQYGERIGLVFSNNKLSYSEIDKKTNCLANKLSNMGVKKDSVVAIIMERSHSLVLSMLSIMKVGAAYLPIDPEYPEDRIQYMLNDSCTTLVITEEKYSNNFKFDDNIIIVDRENVFDGDETPLKLSIDPNDLLYVIYTSGTTGKPKGVLIEHRGLVNYRNHCVKDLKLSYEKKVLAFASPSFDAFQSEIYMALIMGAELHLTTKENLMDPKKLNNYLIENEINVITVPPFLADKLDVEHSNLEVVLTAGSKSKMSVAEGLGKKVNYYNAYGPTEDSICTTIWQYDGKEYGSVPIGRPIPNHIVYILDEDMKLAPIGFPGELCVSGVGLARGYLNKLELTDEKFVTNPYIKESKMYRTGDLARWLDDGNIEYIGRIDNQVKIRGFRIELSEIEEVMLRINGIRHAIVVADADENGEFLCAYYVSNHECNTRMLRNELKRSLPDYMIPSHLIEIDQIPLTINGKLDKASLPKVQNKSTVTIENINEMSENERMMVGICSKVLNIDSISIYDNLFEIGLDSVRVIQIATELRKKNYDISIGDFFIYPTIHELQNCIVNVVSEDNSEISEGYNMQNISINVSQYIKDIFDMSQKMRCFMVNQKKTHSFDLLPIQYGYVNNNEITGSIISIDINVSSEIVKKAVKNLIRKHEALRCILSNTGPTYHWDVHEYSDVVDIPFVDISNCNFSIQNDIKRETIKGLFNTKLDMIGDLLYNIAIIKENTDKYTVILAINHIIYDSISNDIVRREILNYCTNAVDENYTDGTTCKQYSQYGENLQIGPVGIDENQIIEEFNLEEYIKYKEKLRFEMIEDKISEYKIYIPIKHRETDVLQTALSVIYSLTKQYFELNIIPFLMVCMGREYKKVGYYDILGNCVDVVPMILKEEINTKKIYTKLHYLNEHNINFASLALNTEKNKNFDKTTNLVRKVMDGSNIIINIQGVKSKIPVELDNETTYSNVEIAKRNMLFIVRYDDNKVEITMTLPYECDEAKVKMLINEYSKLTSML